MSDGKVIPLRTRRPSGGGDLGDEALVAACAVGDRMALGILFERHHRGMYGFLSRVAGTDTHDLDDLVQATFLEAFSAARRYRGGSAVRTWLFGIAANVARHHVRGEVRRKSLHARAVELPTVAPARADDTVERGELLARIGDALAAMPHDLRVVYVMCVLEEIPGVDVAKTLGVPEGTVWRRLHHARAALRAVLEGRSR